MSVLDALERELKDSPAAGSTLAATARVLAAKLDDPSMSGHVIASIASEMVDVLEGLRALAPPKLEDDEIERARKRRVDRLARQAAAGSASSS